MSSISRTALAALTLLAATASGIAHAEVYPKESLIKANKQTLHQVRRAAMQAVQAPGVVEVGA